MSKNNSFIPYKRIIDNRPFSTLMVDVVAVDNTEIQIQVEKSDYDDFYFDLNVESAIKLRDTLNEFIADRDK